METQNDFLLCAIVSNISTSHCVLYVKYTIYPLSCFSDPYCMLGIRPGPPPAKPQVQFIPQQ
jgi:hypothetical protein